MYILEPAQKKQIETPCLVIDCETVTNNIQEMQNAVTAAGCDLRPHIKTHKMIRFAKQQVKCGAVGITCAKISEAEVMARGGLRDIFIAYPVIGDFRLRRVMELYPHMERMILAIDSVDGAKMLNEAAREAGLVVEARLEIDTGCKRTGIPCEEAIYLAKRIQECENINLTGIYTFKGLIYKGEQTTDTRLAAREEGELLQQVACAMKDEGIEIFELSAGSTPTAIEAAKSGLVSEVRPGTYVFNDYMVYMQQAAKYDDIAALIYCTVVSTPAPHYAVIDAGSKTFPMDITPNTKPYFYPGYAVPIGIDGQPDFNLQLCRLSEEHGMITAKNGVTGLRTGQVIPLAPIHVCPAVNLQNEVYIHKKGSLEVQTVDARGKLQ